MNHKELVNWSEQVREMPRYQCHKQVHALKIEGVDKDNFRLEFALPFNSISPGQGFFLKHSPEVGGYYVVYEDGYASYSPASAFENGYQAIAPTPDGLALHSQPTTEQGRLINRYCYHAPKGNQSQRYEQIREACLKLAMLVTRLAPESPERCRSLDSLDQVMFLANAAIARNENG